MTQPSARVVADSISEGGHRLTTFEVVMHRFVLAEFNTHRTLSRNSASSRAIPLRRQVERVRENTAFPVKWAAEQPGMQGGVEVEDVSQVRANWDYAARLMAEGAEVLAGNGVHKSIVNRLLEPFLWHTVICTGTAWENFFGLRCNPAVQPEMYAAARAMMMAYEASTPREIAPGAWHLPYIDDEDRSAAQRFVYEITVPDEPSFDEIQQLLVAVSAARCARVSYLTHDGKRDLAKDVELYRRLTSARPMHASPLEHVATPEPRNVHEVVVSSRFARDGAFDQVRLTLPRYGNLLGWHSHRFDVEASRGYQSFA